MTLGNFQLLIRLILFLKVLVFIKHFVKIWKLLVFSFIQFKNVQKPGIFHEEVAVSCWFIRCWFLKILEHGFTDATKLANLTHNVIYQIKNINYFLVNSIHDVTRVLKSLVLTSVINIKSGILKITVSLCLSFPIFTGRY